MSANKLITILAFTIALPALVRADNAVNMVKKAVERSTLDQPGTRAFHLKATLAPSREGDRASNRTGEVEIWWASPTRWRREVRSPEFHQIEIVDGDHDWQKNDGDCFPEWLRETAVALINPIPPLDQVLQQVKNADVKRMMGSTYFTWTMWNTNGEARGGMGASVAITENTGLLFYGGALGWGGLFHDYQNFHGRMVAHTVSVGSPEVTAKVTALEDLPEIAPAFFDAARDDGDTILRTVVVAQGSLGKDLNSSDSQAWPALQDGPLEGTLSTEILVDRKGKVREIGTIVSSNPGVNDVARRRIKAMEFTPHLENGVPVQALALVTIPFKTTRPAGMETFDTARAYFERGRQVSFAATGSVPYILHATFLAKTKAGATAEEGQYVDTWIAKDQWRREASIAKSRYVRSQQGEKTYESTEGPDAGILRLVLRVMEPIPALDTFVESDWRIKRDIFNGVNTVRVLSGYESPAGKLDPEHARGYWFDESGKLVKTHFIGLETRRSNFEDFNGVQICHDIRVVNGDAVGMLIRVTDVTRAGDIPAKTFKISGHEHVRVFTDEVR